MLASQQKQQLKQFYTSLNLHPLEPGDESYVNLFEADADGFVDDPISEIATNISFSETASVGLITGQRGTGKSTELKRLKAILEQEDDCHVFYCNMQDYMNLNTPVAITDFLISLMSALSDQFKQDFNEDLNKESFLARITKFLNTDVRISDVTVKSGVGDIKGALLHDPSFKKRLQQNLKGHVNKIVEQAHKFAQELVQEVRKRNNKLDQKVVVLADSIEQIRGGGTDPKEIYDSVENLFQAHAQSLQIPMLHIIYTVPPFLSPLVPNISRILSGSAVFNLPSVHIKNRDGSEDEHGLNKMNEILLKRCATANNIISVEQVRRLALLSGGDLRNFFRFIRNSINKAASSPEASLPISDNVLKHAENLAERELFLATEDKQWLKKIAETKAHQLESLAELPHLSRFLDTGLVLNYRNGQDWYDVHPLITKQLDSIETNSDD